LDRRLHREIPGTVEPVEQLPALRRFVLVEGRHLQIFDVERNAIAKGQHQNDRADDCKGEPDRIAQQFDGLATRVRPQASQIEAPWRSNRLPFAWHRGRRRRFDFLRPVDAGSVGAGELAAQRAAVANFELAVPQLQQQEAEARGALALLVGRAPEGFTVSGEGLDALAEPPLAAGVPSELLRRRPDLIASESNLQAAHADLIAARAALFPSLDLTASGGVQNPAVQAAVITLAGTGWSLTAGASLVQTIFDGGRRRAVIQEATARQEELVANYRGAILAALLDVENALSAIHYLELQKQAQLRNADQSERAFQGAQLRYREGAAEYLTVLESQRALFAARDQLSQYKLARLQALIGLGKALGGGWQSQTPSQTTL